MLGIFAGIIGVATAAMTTIATTVGPALAGIATMAKGIILGTGSLGISDIIFIINTIKEIAKAVGLIDDKGLDVDELGAKACEAKLQPENFDDVTEYINYLKDEIKLDQEKFENRSEGEALAHKALGAGLLLKGIKDKTNIELSPVFLEIVAKNKLESGEVLGIMESCKKSNLSSTVMLDRYMKNNLPLEEKIKIGGVIIEGMREVNPTLSTKELEGRVTDIELSYNGIK